jgi:drug/metabolite transporter (DMT)-like permease
MAVVNRGLPAVTTSLGILATPVIGVASSTLALGEPVDISLIVAISMILGGIAVGTIPARSGPAHPRSRELAATTVRS